MTNPMQKVDIEKITLNICLGNAGEKLDKVFTLLERITNAKPIKTTSKKRIPTWGIRPGLPIGCKVTLRGKKAKELLKNLLQAVNNTLNPKQFDEFGNIAFGITEYIEIPGVKYDIDVGIIGLEVAITLKKPGLRVKKRKIKKNSIPKKHIVSKEEAIDYIKNEFQVKIIEGDQE